MSTKDEGYRVVPVEPTDAMKLAGGHVNSEWLNNNAPIGESRYAMPMAGVWSAMLAAAPTDIGNPTSPAGTITAEHHQRAVAEAVQAAYERAATKCSAIREQFHANGHSSDDYDFACDDCADAIRALAGGK